MNERFPQNLALLLGLRRLPARLTSEQIAIVLGFQVHDIPALVKAGLLKPLGGGLRNSVKYFAAIDVDQKSNDAKWLDRATKAVSRCKRAEGASSTSAAPAAKAKDERP